MGATTISWTGTRLIEPLTLSRSVRLDDDAELATGPHPAGELLPGFTFNPWLGCRRVSEACRNCYAEAWAKRAGYTGDGRHRLSIWGPPSTTPRVRTSAVYWKRPLRWNDVAGSLGVRFKVFCASLADVGEDHPMVEQWRAELFALIERTPCLDWLLLTKRPATLADAAPMDWRIHGWPKQVWVGSTVEDQRSADERLRHLLRIPARVRFLSCEPLLGPLDLGPWIGDHDCRSGPECGWRGWSHDLLPCDAGKREECAEDEDACEGEGGHCPRCGSPCHVGPIEERGHCLTDSYEREMYPLDWIILGGESGPGHRPLDLGAAEDLAAQAKKVGAAVFVKQDSGPRPGEKGRIPDALWALKDSPEVSS